MSDKIDELIAQGKDPLEALFVSPEESERLHLAHLDKAIAAELKRWPKEWRERLYQLMQARFEKGQ